MANQLLLILRCRYNKYESEFGNQKEMNEMEMKMKMNGKGNRGT